jgi:hypothetical protein
MNASQERMEIQKEKVETKMDTAINTVQQRMETTRPARNK